MHVANDVLFTVVIGIQSFGSGAHVLSKERISQQLTHTFNGISVPEIAASERWRCVPLGLVHDVSTVHALHLFHVSVTYNG